jgi:hypothetical protein
VYTGQCPVLQRRATLNSPASGIHSAIIQRTCPVYTGLSGVTAEQRLLRRQRSPAAALNARQSVQKSGTREVAHRTLYSTCPVRHRIARRPHQSELQRSNPNGRVSWLAHRTVSGVHRTVRCAHRQQTTPMATILVGGYKYHPNRPLQGVGVQATFQVI